MSLPPLALTLFLSFLLSLYFVLTFPLMTHTLPTKPRSPLLVLTLVSSLNLYPCIAFHNNSLCTPFPTFFHFPLCYCSLPYPHNPQISNYKPVTSDIILNNFKNDPQFSHIEVIPNVTPSYETRVLAAASCRYLPSTQIVPYLVRVAK